MGFHVIIKYSVHQAHTLNTKSSIMNNKWLVLSYAKKSCDRIIFVFSIVQNSFETRISGRSFKQVEGKLQLVSTWSGRSFEADDDTYSFGIQLSTSSTEYAVLKLTFSVNQTYGMYYSGLPGTSFSAGLEAEQVDKKTYSKYINDISRQTFLPTKQA